MVVANKSRHATSCKYVETYVDTPLIGLAIYIEWVLFRMIKLC